MGCLDGKVAVITGGGRGIGRAIATLFASEGARLVINDLGCDEEGRGCDPTVARDAAGEVTARGGEAVASALDAADAATGARLVSTAREAFGRVDAIVCAAGIRQESGLLKTTEDDLDRVLAVHLRGPFALARAAADAFLEQGEGGSILLTTGPSAFFGAARAAAVSSSWAAIVGLVRAAAVDLRRHRIRINALCPTARTRQTADLPLFRGIPEGSMSPEHVAPIAAFLASDLAGDITGEVVGVAGGRTHLLTSRESAGAISECSPITPEQVLELWPLIARA